MIKADMFKQRHPAAARIVMPLLAALKVCGACVVAVFILSLLMCVYSYIPVHIANPNGNTDYIWPPNSVWFRATEGISWGKFDSNGYNNLEALEHPDILLLGSSHMEGQYVRQKEHVAAVMNDLFHGEHKVYNMGISGHTFFKICQYLPRNIELYSDSVRYVILETDSLDVNQEAVDEVLEHRVDFADSRLSPAKKLINYVPGLRIIDHKRKVGFFDLFKDKKEERRWVYSLDGAKDEIVVSDSDQPAYDCIFAYLENIEKETGVELIVFYHPTESFDTNGDIYFERDKAYGFFAAAAEKHGIDFVDTADSFTAMYHSEHRVPHGFSTGELGMGHLNAYGHRASAQALVSFIRDKEKKQKEAAADVND